LVIELSDEEKASFQVKFDARLSEGETHEVAFRTIYKETLEIICKMQPSSSHNWDIEAAKTNLAKIVEEEKAAVKSTRFNFKGGQKTSIKLTEIVDAIDVAVEMGFTPLIVDSSEDNKVNTFFSYGNGILLDSKKLGLDKSMRNVPLKELMYQARKSLVNAMKYGNSLIIAMTKAVTDFNGIFTDESIESQNPENMVDITYGNDKTKMCFPLEVFNQGGIALANENNPYINALFRDEDKEQGIAFCRESEKFKVIITTQFEKDDFESFLFDNEWGLPKPKEKYAFLIIEEAES